MARALTERLREAEERRAALEDELEDVEVRDASLDAYREEIDLLNELLACAEANRVCANLFFEAGKELRSPERVIALAQTAFADRMVIMDEAIESACDFKGDAGEMFEGLAALYCHLWPLRFGQEAGPTIDAGLFEARTGFELTFHESKQTNRDARLMRQRQRSYHGQMRDISPHLKGGRRGGYLRVHFFSDDERQLIVVGHCGGHLTTYGTQRL